MKRKINRIGQNVLPAIMLLFLLVLSSAVFAQSSVSVRGANITVASWWSTYNVDTYQARDEAEQQGLNYRRELLRREGFRFQVMELADYDNYYQAVLERIRLGDRSIQIYEVPASMAIALYKQGLIYPVGDSRAVNFNNREMIGFLEGQNPTPNYNALVQSLMTFNRKTYGWQYGLPNNSWGQAMLFFNADHLRAAGLNPEHIYDLQKNNNWTWDTFLDVCRRLTRDTNNDGITDIYAIHMDDAREFIKALIFGNGGNFVTFDARGRAQNALNTPAVIEALNFYNRLINEGYVMTTPEYNWGQNWEAFQQQRVSMTFDPEWRKGQHGSFSAGYVLPPRGPRSRQYRYDAADNVFVIPHFFSAAEVDVFLKAAEMWFTPNDSNWLEGHRWASNNQRDVTETVAMSRDVRYLTPRNFFLIPGYPFDDFIIEFRDGLGRTDPAQFIREWTPRINEALEDFNR